ncbi:hypothetical protein GDO81_002214 [Engystomops pustulosus]|uniref:Immunoglobulin C1-set domain-containing protein n=1 Tax=Engystomops pustulosus TaxID=76066 RepID=A0AAV7DI92_ENGPU|nr:hypothetical protein GDO81_002214 [Engystomops pustulosus]
MLLKNKLIAGTSARLGVLCDGSLPGNLRLPRATSESFSETGEVKAPSVFLYKPSEEELKKDSATVVCSVSDYTPRIVVVEWRVDGAKWTSGVYSSPDSKQSNDLYMKSSLLTMTTSEYNKHTEYACVVTHQGKEIIQTIKTSEC